MVLLYRVEHSVHYGHLRANLSMVDILVGEWVMFFNRVLICAIDNGHIFAARPYQRCQNGRHGQVVAQLERVQPPPS